MIEKLEDKVIKVNMFGIFKRKKVENTFAFLQTDFHNHLLFGLDDGLDSKEKTIAFLQEMKNMGFSKIIFSPHVYADFYPNTTEDIQRRFNTLKAELKEEIMHLGFIAEYMVDEVFMEKLKAKEALLTLGKDKKVLIEMSYLAESPFIKEAIFLLQSQGYAPILAHPERYNFYHHCYNSYEDLKERGVEFQLNTIALMGYYGSSVKKIAYKLLKDNMYDYCCSDMHHERHLEALKYILKDKQIYKTLINYPFKNKDL